MPSPDSAKASRIESERTLESAKARLKSARVAAGNRPLNNSEPDAEVEDAALEVRNAQDDLEDKRSIERAVNGATVYTKFGNINRELDLLWLVLLAGSLGSFLQIAQSYSEDVANGTLKSSSAWWYSLRPFIGAGLALVFYAAVRGGFVVMTTRSSAKASELNPFGVFSVAAMVGMFSKAATGKLGEVFDSLSKSNKAKEPKDTPRNPSAGKM